MKGDAVVTPAVAGLCVTKWKKLSQQVGHGYALELKSLGCDWLPLSALQAHPYRGRVFYESPTLIGCAFAVHRELYDDLRGFDPHMLCWGVEDLDFGLKCWLMGHPILHDPEAVVAHRFQQRFDNFDVPLERLVVNQLRLARKNFTDGVWADWLVGCRARHAGNLAGHPEGLWARVWQLFEELRPSVEQERGYLLARRVHDEFWYAERFGLDWPRLQREHGVGAPEFAAFSASASSSPSPSPEPPCSVDAIDDLADTDMCKAIRQFSPAANDRDAKNHTLAVAISAGPSHGAAVILRNTELVYVPRGAYAGVDEVTYTATDPENKSDSAKVALTIRDRPLLRAPSTTGVGVYKIGSQRPQGNRTLSHAPNRTF